MSTDAQQGQPALEKQEATEEELTISPLLLVASGAAVTLAGALLVGTSYIAGTTKRLKEEGVDLAARRRAVPIAARAFAASTAACCLGAAALGWAVVGATGSGSSPVQPLRVEGGLQQVAALVRQQRDLIAREIQQRQQERSGGESGTPPET